MIRYPTQCATLNAITRVANQFFARRAPNLSVAGVSNESDIVIKYPHSNLPVLQLRGAFISYPTNYPIPIGYTHTNERLRFMLGLDPDDTDISFRISRTSRIVRVIIQYEDMDIPIYKAWYPELHEALVADANLRTQYNGLILHIRKTMYVCNTVNQLELCLPGIRRYLPVNPRARCTGRSTKPLHCPLPPELSTIWMLLNLEDLVP